MKYLSIIGISFALTACSTTAHLLFQNHSKKVTVENLSKYANVHEMVEKSSNFRGMYTYKTWDEKDQWITKEIDIPVDSIKLYCESIDKGFFYADNDKKSTTRYGQQAGTYTCSKNDSVIWAANIRVGRIQDNQSGSFGQAQLIIHTLTAQAYQKKLNSDYQYRVRAEQARQEEIAEAKRIQAMINARKKPTQNDIGRAICKDTTINLPTNMKILGQQHYEQFEGVVVANLEVFQANRPDLKISIRGIQQKDGSARAYPQAHFQNIFLEAGKTIWDNKYGWYLCNS